jgi:hypothetical protein
VTPTDVQYVTGLDLGQAQDFTAIAVLQKSWLEEPWKPGSLVSHYAVRHLERLPLGTSYTAVCSRIAGLFAAPPLSQSLLAVDYTGAGRPVVDMLRRAQLQAYLVPITITGGQKCHLDPATGWSVPKTDLVSVLQVLLQFRRIKIAPTLPEAKTLVRELLNFQVKITEAANETFGAWREGVHDDLVLAIAVAAWTGERHGIPAYPQAVEQPKPLSLAERIARGESNAARRGLYGLGRPSYRRW